MSSIATQQAAQKLELQAQHRHERAALRAHYKPLPMYKVWKEQPQIVSLQVLPEPAVPTAHSAVARTLRALTYSVDAHQHITYQLDRKDVFRDEGCTIAILDLASDPGLAAALATAQQKFGPVLTLTGSEAFQRRALAVAVAHDLTCRFTDPQLDQLRQTLQQQQYGAAQAAAHAERECTTAERFVQSRKPQKEILAPSHLPLPHTGVWSGHFG